MLTVSFRGGEWRIGVGSSGGPRGTFLLANLAGSTVHVGCAQMTSCRKYRTHSMEQEV